MKLTSYLSARDIARLVCQIEATELRGHVQEGARAEALGCLRHAGAGYLYNLIPQDHSDRIAAARLVMEISA